MYNQQTEKYPLNLESSYETGNRNQIKIFKKYKTKQAVDKEINTNSLKKGKRQGGS